MYAAQLAEEHTALLEDIKEKIDQNMPKNEKTRNPFVKYQTPDAWYKPVPEN
jgi:hypothetical protein